MSLQKVNTSKTYYLTKRFTRLYAGIFILVNIVFFGAMIGFFNYAPHDSPELLSCFFVYVLGFVIVSLFISFYKVANEHIIVSENGIEYHSPGTVVEANWKGIEKIAYRWHDYLRVECLVVDAANFKIKNWSSFERNFPAFSSTNFPLSCFAENWRESELGEQIRQYAPHLFMPN